MSGLLDGLVIVVTGAGQGIGNATSRLAAREGATVAACDRNGDAARDAAARIVASGGTAVAMTIDASRREDARQMVDDTIRIFGTVDGLVCAGMQRVYGRAEELSDEDWQLVIDQGLTGYFRCAQEAGRWMLERGTGSIVLVTSIAARRATIGGVAYVSAKSGARGLARQLGVEWAARGVRTNAVAPGFTATEGALRVPSPAALKAIPRGLAAHPDEIAEACVFLLSDRARHITGAEIVVDGGTSAGSA